MTTDLVEKCASDLCVVIWGMDYRPRPGMMPDARWSTALHATIAVIDALADGVSDEMLLALGLGIADDVTEKQITEARLQLQANGPEIQIARRSLSAAIRAAKSREG